MVLEIGKVRAGTGYTPCRLESEWFRSITMSSDQTANLCLSLRFRYSNIASGQQIIHNEIIFPSPRLSGPIWREDGVVGRPCAGSY